MDLKAIEIFHELARSGSIRQTADAFGVSPTAVARQLDKIEHSFGAALVERTPRGVRLTAAGEVLAAKSTQIARDIHLAQQMINDLKGLRSGSVSLHVNGAASSSILAPALAAFSADHPNLHIEVTVTSAKGALDAVATGLTDIAVTMFAPPDSRVETRFRTAVRHEPILSPDHPLAAQSQITIADLARTPLALPDRSFGVRRALDARFRAAGAGQAEPAFTTSSLELQKELGRRGSALLILPQMTVQREIEAGSLVMRPLEARQRIETLLELSHPISRQQSFAARRLLEFLDSFLRREFPTEGVRQSAPV
ncbi:HTH-type transcriptional regulator CynR [Aquimixticola soesokkakensis]|uniref:HTH-type transcriptional regulator CynR n=1 Tax=Aquimixticola soesokkakensis TaxID=1519096 RepID=A0A1Y5SRH4_9RHOB|nr:LysR family transcriptional regulator [Aquimixticola soesokkakensis]SLN43596.1 HTH-type transcriptional regulator CynR [Aquimixticola soesokkakensis]